MSYFDQKKKKKKFFSKSQLEIFLLKIKKTFVILFSLPTLLALFTGAEQPF